MARSRRPNPACWLDLDEEAFYSTFYCSSVTRCYPGRLPGGRGDRRGERRPRSPSATSGASESSGSRPRLVLPVGGLAVPRGARHRANRRLRGEDVRPGRRARRPASASLRRERLAQRRGEPGSARRIAGARPRGARAPLVLRRPEQGESVEPGEGGDPELVQSSISSRSRRSLSSSFTRTQRYDPRIVPRFRYPLALRPRPG